MSPDITHLPSEPIGANARGATAAGTKQLRNREIVQIAPSGSVYAIRLLPEEVLPIDLVWLDKALEGDYHEVMPSDIVKGFLEGRFDLWRLPNGIAVTTIMNYPAGNELYCAYVAGVDYISNFNLFMQDMTKYAIQKNCKWFAGAAKREALRNLYSSWGDDVGTLYIRKIL